jgi:hypothetical protein
MELGIDLSVVQKREYASKESDTKMHVFDYDPRPTVHALFDDFDLGFDLTDFRRDLLIKAMFISVNY